MAYLEEIPVKLTETKAQNLLSVRHKMNVKDYGGTMAELLQKVQAQKLTPTGPPMTIFHDQDYDPENYDMEIALPVMEAATGTRDFPAQLCGVSTLKGDYSGLPGVYAALREWMEAGGYTLAGPPFEIYLTDPGQTPPDENVTEVYLPVKKTG